MESRRASAKRPSAGSGLDLAVLVVLFVASLGVRWQYARAVVLPPSDASAFYLTTAANAVEGRGLEVDVLWSYQVLFPNVTHPSHDHWMPLTTGLIAVAFAIQRAVTGFLEPMLQTGQMPGLIVGSLLAPLTYLFGLRVLPQGRSNRWVSLGAALLVVVNATLSYQSASADSSAIYALVAFGALAVAVRRPGEQGGYLGAGLLVALAYLTRADALLLLVAIPLAWWLLPLPARRAVEIPDTPAARLAWERWPRQQRTEEDEPRPLGPGLRHVVDLLVAFALVVTPWLVRNYLAFGTPLPSSILNQAWLWDYVDTFNYLSHPTLNTWLAQPWSVILDQRVQALANNARVLLLGTFPWGVLALPGMWLLRRESSFFPSVVYGVLLFFVVSLIFPVSAMFGTFYHSFGAVIPFLVLAAMYAVERGTRLLRRRGRLARFAFISVGIALLALSGWQVLQSLSAVGERHSAQKVQFEAAADWLAQNAKSGDVVMTTQPYTLSYVSRHPAIVLPGNEPPDAAWQAAQRYNARFLIVTQQFGLYPEVLEAQPDPRFQLLAEIESNKIFDIGGDAP
ncbi:MAG: hypothetical protein PVI67_04975 [Anaerolineae bacterium]